MISIIGIGNAASAIAGEFAATKNYQVYKLGSEIEKTVLSKREYKLKSFSTPEEYEQNIPNLTKFFKDVNDRVQVFVVGSSYSSNYCLGILQQLKDKEIDLFYVKPDIDLLTGVPQLMEKVVFSVMQEYARSGLLKSITLLSNQELEKIVGDVPIKTYYEVLNKTIFSMVHYLNFFEFGEPEIGQVTQPSEINRIRSVARLNMKNLEEKWFFDLDTPRELCYYLCINQETLESDGSMHRRIVEMLKNKPRNSYRNISYAIYETEFEDFGFCVAHTNVIQSQKTLDSLETE
tara:strand:- start:212 stop:1081 length:870 start_codon:yes stop_codon:yes gene_type:complete